MAAEGIVPVDPANYVPQPIEVTDLLPQHHDMHACCVTAEPNRPRTLNSWLCTVGGLADLLRGSSWGIPILPRCL